VYNHRPIHTYATVIDNRIYRASDSSKPNEQQLRRYAETRLLTIVTASAKNHSLLHIQKYGHYQSQSFWYYTSHFTKQQFQNFRWNHSKHIILPKKDQAIVFNSIEDVPQVEYIKAFSQLISPTNKTFASRISNNRFCVYFVNKNIVDQIIIQQTHIVINNSKIIFRQLIYPAKHE